MKKKLLTVALALAVLGGFQINAQNNNEKGTCPKQEQVCKNAKTRDGKSPRMDKQQRAFFGEQAFDGIQLTDAQKAGLKTLNEKQQAKREEMKAQKEVAKKDAKQRKQQMDSTKRAARTQARRDYLNGVKGVLTPDQYVVFLENIVVESPVQQNGPKMGRPEGKKDMKAGMDRKDNGQRKGDRPMASGQKAKPAKDAKRAAN